MGDLIYGKFIGLGVKFAAWIVGASKPDHRPFSKSTIGPIPSVLEGRAGEETRTLDIFLGKEVLYQLSYTRGGGSGK